MNRKRDSATSRPLRSADPVLQALPESLEREIQQARAYLAERHAPATRRAYRADWQIFDAWCKQRGLVSLPADPESVALFLADEAGRHRSPATLRRRLAAIRLVHLMAEQDSPTSSELVRGTFSGIRRVHGTAPAAKAPAIAAHIRAMVNRINPETRSGARDRALLLFGFAGAFRRSELVGLQVGDLERRKRGIIVHLRKSKTDQEGAGDTVPILQGGHYCPVEALNGWLKMADITEGPIFRRVYRSGKVGSNALSSHSVALIVKRWARQAGFDPEEFAGHSLRSGFLTSAAMNRASLFKMMEVSRHKDPKAVMRYVRQAEAFDDHAGEGLL